MQNIEAECVLEKSHKLTQQMKIKEAQTHDGIGCQLSARAMLEIAFTRSWFIGDKNPSANTKQVSIFNVLEQKIIELHLKHLKRFEFYDINE